MSIIATPGTACPSWCNDHTGFDDGSEDWHKSADRTIGETTFYISTGTLDHTPEVFVEGCREGMSLDQAAALARAILAAVEVSR